MIFKTLDELLNNGKGWIKHTSEVCPVDANIKTEVVLSDLCVCDRVRNADAFDWRSHGKSGDVIAYRVVQGV